MASEKAPPPPPPPPARMVKGSVEVPRKAPSPPQKPVVPSRGKR